MWKIGCLITQSIFVREEKELLKSFKGLRPFFPSLTLSLAQHRDETLIKLKIINTSCQNRNTRKHSDL